jgi:hypothetical protein
MSSPIFNLGNQRGGSQSPFSLLETFIDARANAQRQFLSELRRRLPGMPLLDAGLQFAEILATQQRDFGRTVIQQMERAMFPQAPHSQKHGEPGASECRSDEGPEPESASAETPVSALRLTIPFGTQAVAVPLQLRNHRQSVDTVSLTAIAPADNRVAGIPTALIGFDPETLAIPPHADAAVQMLLRMSSSFLPGREYWSEIVITGAETKRIPFVVQIRPAT